MSAKKTAAKKTGGKMAVNADKEMLVLTADHLSTYPELAEKGFVVGQEIEVEVGQYSLEAEETEDEGRSEEDEESMSAEKTGKFIVRMISEGKYRLYNPEGQAISPIVEDNEDNTAIQSINKMASRFNALEDTKKMTVAKKKVPEPTVQ